MKKNEKNILSFSSLLLILILVNGFAFSKGFLGWSLRDTGDPVGFAGAVALIFTDILLIGYSAYACFSQTPDNHLVELHTLKAEDYYEVIDRLPGNVYRKEQNKLKQSIRTFDTTIIQLHDLILQIFGTSSITTAKYEAVLNNLQQVFYDTVNNLCNRMKFDPKEKERKTVHKQLKTLQELNDLADKQIAELLKVKESSSRKSKAAALESINSVIETTKFYQNQ